MTMFGYKIAARVIAMIVGGVLLLVVTGLLIRSCDKRRSMAAQSRVERAQGDAASNSAADAVNTISAAGEAQAASEAQTRQNEKDIRAARGAGQAVDPAARDAGIRALCKRQAYKNDPRCKQ